MTTSHVVTATLLLLLSAVHVASFSHMKSAATSFIIAPTREEIKNGNLNKNKAVQSNSNINQAISSSSSSPSTLPQYHFARRFFHAVGGLVLIVISHIIPPYPVGCLLALLATAELYVIHMKRVKDPRWDEWYLQRFGSLLRNHERGEWGKIYSKNNMTDKQTRKSIPELPGSFYFLLGVALSSYLFPTNIARTSVVVLSLSDPIAGLVGSWFTRKGINIAWKKLLPRSNAPPSSEGGPSVVGSFAFALSTILCTYVYIPTNSTTTATLNFYSRLCIGVVASMTEALGGRHLPLVGKIVDDNLLVPLVVGCLACWLDDNE